LPTSPRCRAESAAAAMPPSLSPASWEPIGYFRTLLRLSHLAPDIVEAILDGNNPPQLTRQKLARFKGLPLDWSEQRWALEFA
jgi:hypothetical protein